MTNSQNNLANMTLGPAAKQQTPKKPCEACRKRKIKCDKQVPACSQCTRAGSVCPGYQLRWQNYTQSNASIAKLDITSAKSSSNAFPLERLVFELRDETSSGNSSGNEGTIVKRKTTDDNGDRSRADAPPFHGLLPQLHILTHSTESLRANFVAKLRDATVAARFSMLPSDAYLAKIPERIGTSSLLDSAVKCICIASNGIVRPNSRRDLVEMYSSYASAIKDLQRIIQDEDKAREASTLATVMLLHMYELHMNQFEAAWVGHARGAMRLIQHRGPEAFESDLELAIFEAEMGNIFGFCIELEQHCFLADSAWSPVFDRLQYGTSEQEGRRSAIDIGLFRISNRFPGLLSRFSSWRRQVYLARVSPSALIPQTEALLVEARDMRQRFKEWRVSQALLSKQGQATSENEAFTLPEFDANSLKQMTQLEWAFLCSSSTFRTCVNHIILQLLNVMQHLLSGADALTDGENVMSESLASSSRLWFSLTPEILLLEASDLAETSSSTFMLLRSYYGDDVLRMNKLMTLIWMRTTAWPEDCLDWFDDIIIKKVEPFWPME